MNGKISVDAPLFADQDTSMLPREEYDDYLDRIGYDNIVAKAKAEAGKRKALANPEFTWYGKDAMEQIRLFASWPDYTFSADDVTHIIGPPPNPFVLGAAFSACLQRKEIEKVGWKSSERISSHGRVLRTYRGRDK